MKVLCVLNGGLAKLNDAYYVNKTYGDFFNEVITPKLELEVFYMSEKVNEISEMTNFLVPSYIKVTSVNVSKFKILTYLFSFIKLIKLVFKAELVYIFYPGNLAPLVYFINCIFKRKIGLYIRGEVGLESRFSKKLINNAAFILSVSDYFKSKNKIIMTNFTTIRPMIQMQTDEIVHDRKYINKKVFSFLFVGRIEARKGIFDLIKAVKILASEEYNFRVEIVGDGPDLRIVRNHIKHLDIEKYIVLHDAIANWDVLKNRYLENDVFIFPSHDEGFPRVLYEAMGMGIPIITTFVGAIPHLMVDRVNCYKINVSDPVDIVDKIKMIIENYCEHANVAKAGTLCVSEYLAEKSESHGRLFLKNAFINIK